MRSSNSADFAPWWVKCICCCMAMLPLPGVIVAAALRHGDGPLLMMLPVVGYISLVGLYCVIDGRPPRTGLRLAVDLLTSWLQATCVSRRLSGNEKSGDQELVARSLSPQSSL
jgi:hypothetical protein